MPRISLKTPDGETLSFDLTGPRVTVGRGADNDLQIEDVSISSHHAEFMAADDTYELVDLGSTNGSKVNGQPVERKRLTPGDQISLGNCVGTFQTKGGSDELPELHGAAASVGGKSRLLSSGPEAFGPRDENKKSGVIAIVVTAVVLAALITFAFLAFSGGK
ncbi:MAG: FHA domain-containing protein [Verrucomicrobiales bacterium]